MTKYNFAWPSSISINDYFPSIQDIVSGYAGNPVTGSVPTGQPYDPTDPSLIAFRPKDYGQLQMSDDADEYPNSPTNGFAEFDYSRITTPSYESNGAKQVSDEELIDEDKVPLAAKDPKPEESWLKLTPNYSVIGRVIRYNSTLSTTEEELPEGADPDVVTNRQYYDVRLPDGRMVPVRQMQIQYGDRIPSGTMALVVYDQQFSEFQMQVPVFLAPSEEHLGEEDV